MKDINVDALFLGPKSENQKFLKEMIEFMILPFIACLILTGITVYFGIHVIKREIIFIDIALAQIAALGSSVALVLQEIFTHQHIHHAEHAAVRTPDYALSLLFILIAAMIFYSFEKRLFFFATKPV